MKLGLNSSLNEARAFSAGLFQRLHRFGFTILDAAMLLKQRAAKKRCLW